ncbi:MAG: carboxypeptidase-like regulatory domain-containing protein, partial [Chitinophagaceae bacterium]|nr:carboxypeptidase-like regulatory domain-containing protein [Chitinophagaceae bacterium]
MDKLKILLTCFLSVSFFTFSFAQNRNITGKVANASDKSPLIGATVTVKGTNNATTTSIDGTFSISIQGNDATLVISSVGFASK